MAEQTNTTTDSTNTTSTQSIGASASGSSAPAASQGSVWQTDGSRKRTLFTKEDADKASYPMGRPFLFQGGTK
ncbi:hypothetical protein IAT38_000768 [Cryptococcus sp. DSM 104549]